VRILEASFAQAHSDILALYPQLKTVKSYDGRAWTLVQGREGQMDYQCDKQNDIQDFGTTAVVVLIRVKGGQITDMIVANTGDSIAYIAKEEGGGLTGEIITVSHNSQVRFVLSVFSPIPEYRRSSSCFSTNGN
jgi:serine/threonine protein phosphatase PrpC